MQLNTGSESNQVEEKDRVQQASRRQFLQLAGGLAGAGLFVASCRRTPASTIYIGSGDRALLNYLLIMEELQTNFYTQANNTEYYGATALELELLKDLRDQQMAHKGLLKTLMGTSAIPDIVTDLSSITFADRTSTLSHAMLFEDLAVAAYNGVVQYFTDTTYTLMVAKMASVEARHAAYVRDIMTANSFSDTSVVNTSGLDQALSPKIIMNTIAPYIQTTFNIAQLPG